jgi:hypothetical protein
VPHFWPVLPEVGIFLDDLQMLKSNRTVEERRFSAA